MSIEDHFSYRFSVAKKTSSGRLELIENADNYAVWYSKKDARRQNLCPTIYSYYSWDENRYVTYSSDDHQLMQLADPGWKKTQRERFRNKDYSVLPFPSEIAPIEDHFAHLAEDGRSVEFIASEQNGLYDKRTKMNPGRYLTKFYPDLHPDRVRELACLVDKANEIHFAKTEGEWERVYTNGPNSCMSHSSDDFSSSIHPVRVYAAGDLELAYLANPSDPDNITARVIVWPEKKVYSRIYGDEIRLGNALKALGYKKGSLIGARIQKIREHGGYVAPYIDENDWVYDSSDKTCFVIGCDPYDMSRRYPDLEGLKFQFEAHWTHGLSYEDLEDEEEDDEEYLQYCEYNQDYYDTRHTVFHHVRDVGETWSQMAVDEYAFFCSGYSAYYSNDVASYPSVYGGFYSQNYIDNHDMFLCPKLNAYCRVTNSTILKDTGERTSTRWANAHGYFNHAGCEFYERDPSAPSNLSEAA